VFGYLDILQGNLFKSDFREIIEVVVVVEKMIENPTLER
jgi:hypothetical protein